MDQWFQTWVRPGWRLAQGVPQVLEEETLRSLVKSPLRLQVEETFRVRAEESFRQQAG